MEILQFLAISKLAKVVEFTLENTHLEIGVLKKKHIKFWEKTLTPRMGIWVILFLILQKRNNNNNFNNNNNNNNIIGNEKNSNVQ
jgi:hypothetical protein